ncbi:flavin reductase family protein [Thermoanaerobacterium sp. RBIITD]|uniref:flavin reductase family protein n=1 Tax=Thermoanaerobacterium sp. RBIITD TaxID=1550240 RepID=UPI000BB6D9EE|nr:flavin reductase family protein [Thermoanaerobacterium sp. RBIITD]SNX53386.1 NADH-FMN oxidoreductase RutF, flavin reductase (DIM6/NTAB) family [Thermoanaerobacterium sp. RBIITD]
MGIKEVPYDMYIKEVNQKLTSSGIFLTTKADKLNTMIIGWGGITYFWGKPIFVVAVRESRFTHNQIEKSGEFTVNIPLNEDLRKAIAFCGTKSGRDYDKFKECNLTAVPSQKIETPVIGECSLHYECKVVYKQDMIKENLDANIDKKWYPDYHTMYFGEIVACYIAEN